ncbi:MAG: acetyltransferase [Candidatus Pedobacter colombiensis]|uniref:Acetyltransferase n=1 Tax=Candidatus Pedobacter colombiensis TaxID=3121371 RepID=A0AAJ6B8Q6_9SPHI|nr:acetyltransferase [Pedobacter sp.]WEK20746.1 MAG: acetyltransferase [Pedobacter sp.]
MKVVVYGTGKMAELICYSFNNDSPYEVVAFCVDDAYAPLETELLGLPILSFEQVLTKFPKESHKIHVAIGRNNVREVVYHKVRKAGYSFANYISSRANVWPDLVTGQNTFIDQASVIHPFVTIGNNCMLIGTRIGHHSTIRNNVLLSGNILAGNVTIGNNSFLGINSSVKEDVCIGNNNIIGAGVFIRKDTEDYSIISDSTVPQRVGDSKRFIMFNKSREVKHE